MDSAESLIVWSYGFAALAYAVFSLQLLALGYPGRGRLTPQQGMFAAVLASLAWGLAGWLFGGQATRLDPLDSTLDALRFLGWSGFVLLLLHSGDSRGRSRAFQWIAPAVLGVIAVRLFASFQTSGSVVIETGVSRWFLYSALTTSVLGLVLVEQLYRNVAADSRWNIKPLCIGLAGMLALDLYFYADGLLFNHLDPDVFSIRGLIAGLVVPMLMLSTTRSRDWVSKVRLSQRAAFHTATLMLAGVFLLFVAGVGYYVRYFGGEWGRALQVALVFAGLLGFISVAVSGIMRAKLRVWLGKHFFSYRYDYRDEWLRFTQTLNAQDSPQSMGLQVIRGMADLVESPAGGLWLVANERDRFVQFARWNVPEMRVEEPADSELSQFLNTSGWVIDLEEYRSYRRRYADLTLPEWLFDLPNAWLIIPLLVGDELIGFVVLSSARTNFEVNWEVIDLLKTASRQAASFLAQMQATEKLLEVRKFDAFNRMSAFVVHDLKNIVTQLSLMLKNAERHKDNPEFQEDMLMTVNHSVERMRQLMLQLREGATPTGGRYGVDLVAVLRAIQERKDQQGRQVELVVDEKVITRGHEDRIERIIDHMVQNALDATDETGRVWIRLARDAGRAKVEVGDTGHGMSQAFIRDRLFKPFQTTKSAGMGIGAYESFQYVKDLGGKINVESEVGRGTVMTLLLPLFEENPDSDLRAESA